MLQFIMGRSGSGKTAYIKEQICSLIKKERETPVIFLVPEQQSFEMERAMLDLLGPKDCRRVEVLSFSRLIDFVFRQRGGFSGRAVDDGARSIIMSLAIEQAQDELTLYRKQVGRPELISLMLTAVKEFKMCAVTTDLLRETARSLQDEILSQKLNETALVADIYNTILSESYVDPLDGLTRLYESVLQTPFFTGYAVFADGFSGFTMQEQRVLELMVRQSASFTIALSGDQAEFASKDDLFFTTRRTKRWLKEMASKNNVPCLPDICLDKSRRFLSGELAFLEENIYRPGTPPYSENHENGVTVFQAKDVYDESDYIARTIRRLTIEKGLRYGDIAVICRSLEPYRGILDTTFEQYGLSYFMDKPQEIASKPLTAFILSGFEAVHTYFSAESIFRLLKTGVAGMEPEQVALLENYAFVWNISGGKWTEAFTQNPRGYADEFTEQDKRELKKAEALRRQAIGPLVEFKERVANADGLHISKAVYRLLEAFHVASHLKEKAGELRRRGENTLAEEQERLWDILIAALDQMSEILGGRHLSSRRYCELFRLVIRSAELAFIPNSLDEVTIGTADRIRLSSPQCVFVIGANEGEFPHLPVAGGIFTDHERRRLISLSLPLYDGIEELSAQEKFLAYCAVSAPRRALYLTCYESGLGGEQKSPSSLIREVRRLFPQKEMENSRDVYWTDKLCAEKPAFELCAEHYGEETAQALLKTYFEPLGRYGKKIDAVARVHDRTPQAIENRALSERLFGAGKIKLSASQVERFYQCPFQYFCRYGLRAKERKSARIDSAEYGSLIHFLMEQILRGSSIEELAALKKEELEEKLDVLTEQYLEQHFGGGEDKSKRYLTMLGRMKASALMLISHMLKELSQSAFVPEAFELYLGDQGDFPPYEIGLPGGQKVIIEGYIDRVDVMRKEDRAYIRVVDYKTGAKKFVLSDVLFGLNLQMLIYLHTVTGRTERGTQARPAGVLYMPAASPVVNAEHGESAESLESKREKTFRMNGLLLDDLDVIKGMEPSGRGIYIPVTLKEEKPKKGKADTAQDDAPTVLRIDKGAEYVVSGQEMDAVFGKIDELIGGMARRLMSGDIGAVPAKGTYDACKWCPYLFACGYQDGDQCAEVTEDKNAFRTAANAKTEETEGM